MERILFENCELYFDALTRVFIEVKQLYSIEMQENNFIINIY